MRLHSIIKQQTSSAERVPVLTNKVKQTILQKLGKQASVSTTDLWYKHMEFSGNFILKLLSVRFVLKCFV